MIYFFLVKLLVIIYFLGHFTMESRPSTSRRVRATDDDFEETVMKWFENCDDHLASDIDSDYDAIEDDHDSDSIGEEIVDDARDIEENIEKKYAYTQVFSIYSIDFVYKLNKRVENKI